MAKRPKEKLRPNTPRQTAKRTPKEEQFYIFRLLGYFGVLDQNWAGFFGGPFGALYDSFTNIETNRQLQSSRNHYALHMSLSKNFDFCAEPFKQNNSTSL